MTHGAIRPARPDDIGALATIHAAAVALAYAGIFPAAVPPPEPDALVGRWATLLAGPRTWIGVLEVDDGPAGMIGVRPSPDADASASTGELCGLHVRPSEWSHGFGRSLVERALVEAIALDFGPLRLWVLEANVRARRLYVSNGWEPDGAGKSIAAGVREVRYRRTR